MKKRIIAAVIAALFIVASLPVLALGASPCDTPAGYDENDYQKLLAFMETEDENGVKNGEKIVAAYNGFYLPDDPAGWSWYYYDHDNAILYTYGVFFTSETPMRVGALCFGDMDLVGELDASLCTELDEVYASGNRITSMDFSGCTRLRALLIPDSGIESLDISGCTGLDALDCSNNRLRSIDASDCPGIRGIECAGNMISELEVSGCGALEWLGCRDNCLTELDISGCTAMSFLECRENALMELDMSANAQLPFDRLAADGAGFVAYTGNEDGGPFANEAAVAAPMPGAEFLGWYNESGELVSADAVLHASDTAERSLVARFGGASIPGDANGDGAVDMTDALLVLRFALGLAGLPSGGASCDMNGDGAVDATDALLVLRTAMGLI